MSNTMSRSLSVHQEHELLLALEKAGIVSDEAQAVITSKKNQLANDMLVWLREQLAPTASTSDVDYSSHLLSLEDQLTRIVQFDKEYWDGWLGHRVRFGTIPTSSDHVQSVDDLEIFYVDFGSAEKNMEMWWKVLADTHPNAWRYDSLKTDPEHLRLVPNARQYEPGIYRVRINLVAHWESENGRSVDQVREQASRSGETLAAAEILAAYGLHDMLLRQMDGENLPYADLAGFEVTVPGNGSWTDCPSLYWGQILREVKLDAGWTDDVSHGWAAPVVWES